MVFKSTIKHIVLGVFFMVGMSHAFAESQGLSQEAEMMIPIAVHTTNGDMDKLADSVESGLASGLTVNEIKEVMVHIYAYAGFPRSLNGLGVLLDVVQTQEEAGKTLNYGPEASDFPEGYDSLGNGTENQTELVGRPVSGELYEFAPVIDEFLKAHLFGDIFQRDVLSWPEREIVTLATLATMSGVNSQLGAHYFISLNNGITPDQLRAFVVELEATTDAETAQNATAVLEQVLNRI